jgi:hypothetical protein
MRSASISARWALVAALGAGLAACAPEVVRRPTQLTPGAQQPPAAIEMLLDVSVPVGPGYKRTLPQGSVWTSFGRIAEGEVFKPVDRVLTVEGTHVHEAYLVLDGDRLVGYYLPVEKAFAPIQGWACTPLPLKRR